MYMYMWTNHGRPHPPTPGTLAPPIFTMLETLYSFQMHSFSQLFSIFSVNASICLVWFQTLGIPQGQTQRSLLSCRWHVSDSGVLVEVTENPEFNWLRRQGHLISPVMKVQISVHSQPLVQPYSNASPWSTYLSPMLTAITSKGIIFLNSPNAARTQGRNFENVC